jgi:hypothetical protein
MASDPKPDQGWAETDLLKWAREHAPELADIIENYPASDILDGTVSSDRSVTALWFWEDNSQNTSFINAQRAKRLADYYSRHINAESLEPMQRNFKIDRGRADPEAKRRRTQKGLRRALIRKAFQAYMAWAPQEKAQWRKRAKTMAVRQILESWITQGWAKDKGFERTIWRRLPKKK